MVNNQTAGKTSQNLENCIVTRKIAGRHRQFPVLSAELRVLSKISAKNKLIRAKNVE
jgi:hypothetical protein